MSEEAPGEILSVAHRVEAAAYAAHGSDTSTTYKAKMRSLHLNLKMKPNVGLWRDIFSGAIVPKMFVNITLDELKSEDKRQSDAAMKEENMRESMTPQEEKATSTMCVFPFLFSCERSPVLGVCTENACTEGLILQSLSTAPSLCLAVMVRGIGRGMRSSLHSAHLYFQSIPPI